VTKTALVVTTIAGSDHPILRKLAQGASAAGMEFIAAGDTKSPAHFDLPGCRFLSIEGQIATGFSSAKACPTRHYARKNVGYLEAIRSGAGIIIETDDDNIPRPAFFAERARFAQAALLEGGGWANLYRYFTPSLIWPRGLPLDAVNAPLPDFASLRETRLDCPIQQGLADANPDVDAVYRLLLPLPLDFRSDRRLALGKGAWCPFNSQNTAWWPEAFPLLYLPAHCSFRMTDIWRSFVAQRIGWENGWHVLFHEATVHQERNEHNLMRDFEDEVPGYLGNRRIAEALESLPLKPGPSQIPDNLRLCYRKLAQDGHVGQDELPLLECWLADLGRVGALT
jgi:hypothetical protein